MKPLDLKLSDLWQGQGCNSMYSQGKRDVGDNRRGCVHTEGDAGWVPSHAKAVDGLGLEDVAAVRNIAVGPATSQRL